MHVNNNKCQTFSLQIYAVSYRSKMTSQLTHYNNEKYTSLRMRMLIESPVRNRSSLTTACSTACISLYISILHKKYEMETRPYTLIEVLIKFSQFSNNTQ